MNDVQVSLEAPPRLAFEGSRQFAFDNTSLSIFKECPRKYQLSILNGYRADHEAPPLLFGGWLHLGIEEYDHKIADGVEHQAALRLAVRLLLEATVTRSKTEDGTEAFSPWTGDAKYRTRATLIRSLVWYCEHYQSDPLETLVLPDGRKALELSFQMALPKFFHLDKPYLYCGHIDKIATYSSLGLFIQERKHTVQSMGSYYFDRYNPNSQITGYVFSGGTLVSQKINGAVIDAVQVAIDFSRCARSIQYRHPAQLDEWFQDTLVWITRIEQAQASGSFPMNTESCHKFAGCQFRPVCSKHPGVRQSVLDTLFVKKGWDPLKVRGKGIED
jgi:hypothetical protein